MRALAPCQDLTEQAQVTNWPLRLALVGVMIVLIVIALGAMRQGWRARQRRQADIPPPQRPTHAEPPEGAVAGLYLGSSTAGDWMDRVAVHGLGVRSRAWLAWSPQGIEVFRQGAPSFEIPGSDVAGVRMDRGVATTVRSKDSVVVVTWQLGDRSVDTGFRADDSAGHRTVLDGLMTTFPTGARR